MPTILVSGATGFVGTHLVRELLQRGYRVRAAIRNAASAHELPAAAETVVVGEIGPDTDWADALDGIDAVAHLAGVAHRTGRAAQFVTDYRRVNALGTARLADAVAGSNRLRRLLLVSSIAVTGSGAPDLITEQTLSEPDTPYGQSKYEAEQAVARCLSDTSADWCVLRPALVYGPGNPGNMARLLRLSRLGIPLPLGGIDNRRSFLYVENLVDLVIVAMEAPAASRRTFVVADREAVSTSDLFRLICAAAGQPARLFYLPPRALRTLARLGDWVSHLAGRSVGLDSYAINRLLGTLVVDISLSCAILDWHPPCSLEEGIRRTLAVQ